MAKYIVAPKNMLGEVLIKCYRCGCLYSPEFVKESVISAKRYEECPKCGYDHNDDGNRIPLWKYNLIKWYRGGFKKKEEEPVYKIIHCGECIHKDKNSWCDLFNAEVENEGFCNYGAPRGK